MSNNKTMTVQQFYSSFGLMKKTVDRFVWPCAS